MIDIALSPRFVQDAHLQTNHHSQEKDNDLPIAIQPFVTMIRERASKASNGRSRRQLLIRKEEKMEWGTGPRQGLSVPAWEERQAKMEIPVSHPVPEEENETKQSVRGWEE